MRVSVLGTQESGDNTGLEGRSYSPGVLFGFCFHFVYLISSLPPQKCGSLRTEALSFAITLSCCLMPRAVTCMYRALRKTVATEGIACKEDRLHPTTFAFDPEPDRQDQVWNRKQEAGNGSGLDKTRPGSPLGSDTHSWTTFSPSFETGMNPLLRVPTNENLMCPICTWLSVPSPQQAPISVV